MEDEPHDEFNRLLSEWTDRFKAREGRDPTTEEITRQRLLTLPLIAMREAEKNKDKGKPI